MPKKNKYGKITSSEFSTATWLKNKHLQTLFLPIRSLLQNIKIERKIINLPDGDIISIDTIHKNKQKKTRINDEFVKIIKVLCENKNCFYKNKQYINVR